MRPTLTLTDLLGSRGRVDVLRVLWGLGVPATPADIARRTRLTHPAATKILRDLTREGMVERAPTGRGHTYWLLRDNVYVEEILDQAFLAERDIPDMMFAFIEEAMRESAVSVVLFGSYARGDQTVESDVDLVIVAGDEATKARLQAALETLAGTFRRRFGASLSALVYSREEAAAMRTRAPELFESVWHEGITVLGLDVDEWAIDANR